MDVTTGSRLAGLADTVLIRRFLDGDEAAFRALYCRHTPRLTMTVRRLLGPRAHEVDDVVQETWLAGCRGIQGYRGDAQFLSWLTSIAVRATYALAARSGSADVELLEDMESAPDDSPATYIDLERALAALPDVPRLVVVLHDIEGFTHEEIAEQLGMATGTSKATLSRARRALRHALTMGVGNAER